MKGANGRRCSLARSTLVVLLLAGCCFSSPVRPQRSQQSRALAMLTPSSAENITVDQKPRKLQKADGEQKQRPQQEDWWANPCAVPGGAERHTPPLTSSEEVEMDDMKNDPSLTDTWVIQLRNAILHIRKIEERYEENFSQDLDWDALITVIQDEIDWNMEQIQQHFKEEDFTLSWLPTISTDYEQAKMKTVKAVTELYKGLQRFAVTIECMMGESGCKHIYKRLKRKNQKNQHLKKLIQHRAHNEPMSATRIALLNEIKDQLRTLLCEVQMFLRNVKNGKKLPAPPSSIIIRNTEWVPAPSGTEQMVQDMGILRQYKNYLKKWQNITSDLLKSVDPATRNRRKKKMQEKRRLRQRQLQQQLQQQQQQQQDADDQSRVRRNGEQRRKQQRNKNRQRQGNRRTTPSVVEV